MYSTSMQLMVYISYHINDYAFIQIELLKPI
jgi:hypothetical protein